MPHIRPATAADVAQILAIYAPYISDTAVTFETAMPTLAEFTARVVEGSQTNPWLVAVDNDTVLGYAYASVFRTREAYQWAADCSIYMHPDHRRRNVATALYTSLFACLRLQGYFRVHAGITLPNLPSVALHTRMGFTPVGTYADVGYKLGAWHSVWWCVLALQPTVDNPPTPRPTADVVDSPAWTTAVDEGARLLR
jgi:phosphinothricin acetyltransferase